MFVSFLQLGSNLGNRFENLERAIELISTFIGDVLKKSDIYETAPWGVKGQPNYYNQVLEIETDLDAEDLLLSTQQIEEKMGREDKGKLLPRVIDIDILYFDNQVINQKNLIIPHPQLPHRRFTLVPLVEIAPTYLHPSLKKTNLDLLNSCPDQLAVFKIKS
jgi:2-amino-4-hydroxy-6-hydroxymethyldihydropteridine diphosphokinase